MKIAYLCSRYLPRFRGGTESLTHILAKGFQGRGHEVRVVCVESTEQGNGMEISGADDAYEGVQVHRLNYNWSNQRTPFAALTINPAITDYLVAWLKREKPDCVHVTNCFRITAAALEAPRKLGIPLIMALTEFWFLCPIGTLVTHAGRLCPGAEQVKGTDCLTCFVGLSDTWKHFPLNRYLSPRLAARVLMMLDRGNVSRQTIPLKFAGCGDALEKRKGYLREIRESIDVFLSQNDWETRYFIERGFDPVKMVTIPLTAHAVDPSKLVKEPRAGRVRIGYTGAMVRYKGIETLIEGFSRARCGDRATLEIWADDRADPDYRHELIRLIGNSPHIHWRGHYEAHHLDEIYRHLDLLAIPSLCYETGPLVLFEAFAHHTPVLCSSHGSMPQFIRERENGFLFEPGNAEDCARVIRGIVDQDIILDEMQRKTRLLKSVEEFLNEHEEVYQKLQRRSRSTRHDIVSRDGLR